MSWEAKKTNELFDSMTDQLKGRPYSQNIYRAIMREVAVLKAAGYCDDVALSKAMKVNGLSAN